MQPPPSRNDVVVALEDAADVAAVLRLATIAGVVAEACPPPDLAGSWRSAGGIVIDEPSARRCVAAGLPRRDHVLVVTSSRQTSTSTWRDALALGADQVLALTEEAKVAEWLAALIEPKRTGRLLCCLSARGGAGASTLAAALALAAGEHGDVLLLDVDLHGGGIDYLLGIEAVDGARWPQVRDAAGLLPAAALAESLPASGRVRVLAARGATEQLPPPAVAAVVEAGLRGHRWVVADVDAGSPAHQVLTSYADATLLVVPCEVRAAVAAAALARGITGGCPDVRLVVRPGPGDLRPEDVAAAVGAPVAAVWPWERRLAALTEAGEFGRSWRRSRVASIAAGVLRDVGA